MTAAVPPEVTLKTAETAVASLSQPVADKDKGLTDEHEKLPQEMQFDKAVYGGISYAAQAGTGIVLTNWLAHGGGKRHFTKIAEWLGPNFMSLVSKKKGAEAIEEATATIIVSTMIMVGNSFLLPVKWLENRKPKIVRGMVERSNARRESKGEVIPPEELAYQQQSLTELDKAPKQTWLSLLGGRAFGLGAVYGVLWGIGNPNNKRMEEGTFKAVKSTLNAVGLNKLAKSTPVENYTRIAFYDMFYSTVSASGLYVYSHFIMPPKKRKGAAPEEPVLPPLEEAIIEEVEPRKRPTGHRPERIAAVEKPSGEGWKKNLQQTPLQARVQHASSYVDGTVQQPDNPAAEMAV